MAVWGQGDPRWIVENREDGKNVNNWHWSEVNKLEWTKQRLAELLPGLAAPPLELPAKQGKGTSSWAVRVSQVKSVTGEAMLTTRKGNKRFAFYDLKLTLGWEAEAAAPEDASAAAQGEGEAADDAAAVAEQAHEQAAGSRAAGEATGDADGGDGSAAGEVSGGEEAKAAQEGKRAAEKVSGEITIGEFGSGSDHDDLEVAVTASGDSKVAEKLKQHAHAALWPLVLQQLEQYVKELGGEA